MFGIRFHTVGCQDVRRNFLRTSYTIYYYCLRYSLKTKQIIMKKQKLSLKDLTVKSFITEMESKSKETVKGGTFLRSVCLACDDPYTKGPNCPL